MTLPVGTRVILRLFVLSIFAAAAAGCAASPEVEADLVLRRGKVVTVDEDVPEGQAIAVKGDTILAVGSNRQIRAYIGPNTEVIDLDGALVIPGFIESHGHFLGVGDTNMQLDLMSVANWSEIVSMVDAVVGDAPAGELIRGRGWHQEKWDEVPGLAPGEVGRGAGRGRPGTAHPSLAECCFARQPCRPAARQWSRVVRQCQGHGDVRHHPEHPRSPGW